MSYERSSASPHAILPPIISNECDREFLIGLNAYIDEELGKVKDRYHPEQRYIVYKAAFDQIIDYVTAYKPLLTAIKAEYEDCIEIIRRGQKEAFFLSGKLKAMASEPSTIRNYRKRADELEQRIGVIRDDNTRLRQDVESLRSEREERERKLKEVTDPPLREIKRDRRHIPGLTTEESTDLKRLLKEKEKLERQNKELNITYRTRYAPKDDQMKMKEHLASKVQHRDRLVDDTEFLKMKRMKLKTAVEAAQAYMKIQPPNQTVGDAVVAALTRQGTTMAVDKGEEGMPRGTPSTNFEEDDPTKEKEAEMMLEYIEKFNELLEDNKFEEAAIHSANSPKGILRTPESLQRFTDLRHEKTANGRSPLLAFCDALMSTVLAFGVPPSEFLSIECVKVAYEENRLDLISHWISQDRVTMSTKLGDLLYQFSQERSQAAKTCLALAQKVYVESKAYIPAMICMIQQGRVTQALEYGKKSNLTTENYVDILQRCPNAPQLAQGLYTPRHSSKSLLPLGLVITTLIDCGNTALAMHMLEDIQQKAAPGKNSFVRITTQLSSRTTYKNSETPLRQAIFDDRVTSTAQWHDIVEKCQEAGYDELSIDILAALTLQGIMQTAAENAKEAERLKDEEEKQQMEAERTVNIGENDGHESSEEKNEEDDSSNGGGKSNRKKATLKVCIRPDVEDLGSDQEAG